MEMDLVLLGTSVILWQCPLTLDWWTPTLGPQSPPGLLPSRVVGTTQRSHFFRVTLSPLTHPRLQWTSKSQGQKTCTQTCVLLMKDAPHACGLRRLGSSEHEAVERSRVPRAIFCHQGRGAPREASGTAGRLAQAQTRLHQGAERAAARTGLAVACAWRKLDSNVHVTRPRPWRVRTGPAPHLPAPSSQPPPPDNASLAVPPAGPSWLPFHQDPLPPPDLRPRSAQVKPTARSGLAPDRRLGPPGCPTPRPVCSARAASHKLRVDPGEGTPSRGCGDAPEWGRPFLWQLPGPLPAGDPCQTYPGDFSSALHSLDKFLSHVISAVGSHLKSPKPQLPHVFCLGSASRGLASRERGPSLPKETGSEDAQVAHPRSLDTGADAAPPRVPNSMVNTDPPCPWPRPLRVQTWGSAARNEGQVGAAVPLCRLLSDPPRTEGQKLRNRRGPELHNHTKAHLEGVGDFGYPGGLGALVEGGVSAGDKADQGAS
ncbi:hypothetical protein Cadr_000030929 [Camelus dromedarius]|uniref:Uncharacterized protein n=1 Tax=Camelus dromedarius TaxID=9838 RepID=A0A5N4BZ20_CAMDR|nr:hypothetical protein Cadr_000030929 [Camelus dromedarius]